MNSSRARLKRQRLTSGVLGSLAVVLGAVLLVLRSIPNESWVVVVVLLLSAVLISGREWLVSRETAQQVEGERLAALRCPPCAVQDSNPFALGVTPSEIAERFRGAATRPPYVQRDVDSELDRLLRDSFFVALVGPSKAGKSRTAFEAINRVFPDRLLISPEMPGFERKGLAEAVDAFIDSATAGAVIWLDDLQEYLKAKAIATQDLNAWRARHPHVVVIATIRDGELAALRESGMEIERIVDQAKTVALPSSLSRREHDDALAVYPDEDFQDGIGVHFVAGQRLVERLVAGREINPAGYAIACAAIDRRRAGVSDPASPGELTELANEYLHEIQSRTNLDQTMATKGLAWAAEPVLQDIGLLLRSESSPSCFQPFEYVVAFRDGEVGSSGKTEIPSAVVETLIENHDDWILRGIGHAAMVRRDSDRAIMAFRKLAKNPEAHIAAHGGEDLGKALLQTGRTEEGLRWTQEATECSYPCVAAPASYRLAIQLVNDDEAKAEVLYRRVLEHPQSRIYPKALVNLGLILRSKTSVRSDRNEYGVNFQPLDPTTLSHEDLELETEAREMFEAAIDSEDSEARANGGMALGVLLESRGDPEGAEEAYKAGVAAGGHQARIALAQLYAKADGALQQARELLGEMDESKMHPGSVAYRHRVSSLVALKAGTIAHEIEEMRETLVAGSSETSTDSVRMRLATFLARRDSPGDIEEAMHHFQQVIAAGSALSAEAEPALSLLEAFLASQDQPNRGGN